jgi:outer membrane protein TolC
MEEVRFNLTQAFSLLREKAERLHLLREKSALLEQKLSVQRVKLSLGEVTRLAILEDEIEVSKSKSAILQGISELFLQEISILKLCGLGTFGTYPTPLLPEKNEGGP